MSDFSAIRFNCYLEDYQYRLLKRFVLIESGQFDIGDPPFGQDDFLSLVAAGYVEGSFFYGAKVTEKGRLYLRRML